MGIKELKNEANAAYKAGKWDKAIDLYSKVLEKDDTNYLIYSNRSAAYLKCGKFQNALEDAKMCITIKPDYNKGYGRKGTAYHAMKRYDQAVSAYKDGLKLFPDDEHLLKGLAMSKRARLDSSKAGQASRKVNNTSKMRNARSAKKDSCNTISDFLQQTRRELQLQMAAIQAKLDLITELTKMDQETKADLLFSLIDKDGDGTIDSSELATALRKGNDERGITDSVERAIGTVRAFDRDGDECLSSEEFKDFLTVTSKELCIEFHEFSEFLALQLLTDDSGSAERGAKIVRNFSESHSLQSGGGKGGAGSGGSSSKSAAASSGSTSKADTGNLASTRGTVMNMVAGEELDSFMKDENLMDLFKMFDKEGTCAVPFRDVAVLLYAQSQNLDTKQRTTIESLLVIEKDDKRTLTWEQFGRLILAFLSLAGSSMSFDELADDLTLAMVHGQETLDSIDPSAITVEDDVYRQANELQERVKDKMQVDILSYARLQKLFSLWDVNNDGDISFSELTVGLRKFQNAAGITGDVKITTMALFGFDHDGSDSLDPMEFAGALINYAKSIKIYIHDLIDFMSVSSVLSKEDAKRYQASFKQSLAMAKSMEMQPNNMNYYEAPNDY